MASINCKGKLIELDKPIVMAILNVTQDSFYDGGENLTEEKIVQKVRSFANDGATLIDIGGMSSRPGAEIISVNEELERVIPVIDLIVNEFPELILSIDTVHSEVVVKAVDRGVRIVNDISSGSLDAQMLETVAELNGTIYRDAHGGETQGYARQKT